MRAIVAAMLMASSMPAEAAVPDARKVEALAKQAMAETGARGLAIAVIDKGVCRRCRPSASAMPKASR